jgi:hypothetical protein
MELMRIRLASPMEIEPDAHESWLVLGGGDGADERLGKREDQWGKRSSACALWLAGAATLTVP